MGSGYGIARAIEQLIAAGHPIDAVWKYTPRQLAAYVELAYRRRMGLLIEQFGIMQTAAQGDAKAGKTLVQRLTKEAQ